MKLKKIILISILILLVIMILIFFVNKSNLFKYYRANKLEQIHKYEEAINYYIKILDYKDSMDKLNSCYFNIVSNYIEDNNYIKVKEILFEMGKYTYLEDLLEKCQILLVNSYIEDGKYEDSISFLKEIGTNKTETINQLYIKSIEKLAEKEYDNGNFKIAYTYLEEIQSNSELLEKAKVLDNIQGTYEGGIVISQWNMYSKYSKIGTNSSGVYTNNYVDTFKYKYIDNKIIISEQKDYFYIFNDKLCRFETGFIGKTEFRIENGNLLYISRDEECIVKKISDDVTKPEQNIKPSPKIGMTENDVINSTWGKPNKINKNTYSWGITEQWVYGNGRYIYFKNGKVSSISE